MRADQAVRSYSYFESHLPDMPASIAIGLYYPHGGTDGEFEVSWERVGDEVFAQLQCFSDSWYILHQFQDMLERMAEMGKEGIEPTPEQFMEMLRSIGIVDCDTISCA